MKRIAAPAAVILFLILAYQCLPGRSAAAAGMPGDRPVVLTEFADHGQPGESKTDDDPTAPASETLLDEKSGEVPADAQDKKVEPAEKNDGDTDRGTERLIESESEKADRERVEREKADRERAEKERLAGEQANKEKTKKPKLSVVDLSTKEYLGLFVGYGGFFPVADYGAQYNPANMISGTVGLYVINFVGLSPEFHVRYGSMSNRKDPFRYSSDISLLQFYPAIIYRYHVPLPRNTLTVYARIWDGVSRVSYSSRNPYIPVIKENIVENINVFGLSAGCYYDVWKGLLVGVDLGYSIVFTAGKPLQGMSLTLNVGWRIL